jgi:hypothetical protein
MTDDETTNGVTVIPPVDPDEIRDKLPEYLRDAVRRRPSDHKRAGAGFDVNYEESADA